MGSLVDTNSFEALNRHFDGKRHYFNAAQSSFCWLRGEYNNPLINTDEVELSIMTLRTSLRAIIGSVRNAIDSISHIGLGSEIFYLLNREESFATNALNELLRIPNDRGRFGNSYILRTFDFSELEFNVAGMLEVMNEISAKINKTLGHSFKEFVYKNTGVSEGSGKISETPLKPSDHL